MKRGIRKKAGEDLSDTKIEEVINLLNQDKPITKKSACEILNISYNTTRLNRIIEEYNETKAYHEKRRKDLRSKPLDKEEIASIISSYLEDGNLSLVAEETFRSISVIKRVLERYNIPLRSSTTTYHNPLFLPDNSIAEDYTKDDLVYSARYDQPAYINNEVNPLIYSLWLIKDEQYAYQPHYELADLRKLQQDLGINIETRKFVGDIQQDVNRAIIESRKGKKK